MLIHSLLTLATVLLPWAAQALTLLPLGDGLTAGYHGDGVHVCSYRYALQQLAATKGIPLELLGSVRDGGEALASCSRVGGESAGAHEGHFAASGSDLYSKIESWISSPGYETDQEGRLSKRVDAVVLSMGQKDCLNAKSSDDPSINPYEKVKKDIKWALWELEKRIPSDSVILVVPILMPTSGVSDTATECAAWTNAKMRRVYADSGNVAFLELENLDGLSASQFEEVDGQFLPNAELSETIASAVLKQAGAAKTAATGPLPIPVLTREERARLEGEDAGGEGAGAGAGAVAKEKKDGEDDEYGYAWCLDNYDQNECFDYYYGYDWCTENYDKDECFDYYYGYDWCVKYYDQQECHDYYYSDDADDPKKKDDKKDASKEKSTVKPAEETDDEDSGSGSGSGIGSAPVSGSGEGSGSGDDYGYDWCLENYDQDDCFDYYYGYKWCLDYYDDDECYDYYYPPDFEWNEQSNYKWCLNFYLPDDCETRYYPQAAGDLKLPEEDEADSWFQQHKGLATFGGLFAGVSVCGLGYWCYKRRSGSYSRLDPHGEGDGLI